MDGWMDRYHSLSALSMASLRMSAAMCRADSPMRSSRAISAPRHVCVCECVCVSVHMYSRSGRLVARVVCVSGYIRMCSLAYIYISHACMHTSYISYHTSHTSYIYVQMCSLAYISHACMHTETQKHRRAHTPRLTSSFDELVVIHTYIYVYMYVYIYI